jgi:hypothetical protein
VVDRDVYRYGKGGSDDGQADYFEDLHHVVKHPIRLRLLRHVASQFRLEFLPAHVRSLCFPNAHSETHGKPPLLVS